MRIKPTQEITSVSSFYALILSHCTSKITDGNSKRQGVSHHERRDIIYLTLGTLWAHIQPSVLCHSFPPWGLRGFSAQNSNCLWPWQTIRDSKVQTCKQCLMILSGVYGNQKLQSSVTTANKPFSSGLQGLCTCTVNKRIILTKEGWTSFDRLQLLKSKALPGRFWGPEQPKEELISILH